MTSVIDSPRTGYTDPLITKVMPPKRPFGLVRRDRLHRTLARAIDRHRLALLMAPAGYGKTSLIADFLDDCSAPVCWYSIDPEDNDARTFLRYLVAAIRRQFPDFGDGILRALNSSSDLTPSVPAIIGAFVSELQQQILDWFVLVIEDVHWCDDPALLTALDLLLRHLPDNCFLILSSRNRVPVGAISRLTAQRSLTRLTGRDLAFRQDEVLELLRTAGHTPDPATADRLTAESEGWIAGIVLLAPWLDQPSFISALDTGANQEELFWYLSEQVFQQLPQQWQALLLRSSILQDVGVEVCASAFGFDDARALLKQMEEAGLFITELHDGETYRYHALFRQFLLKRAEVDGAPLAAWHRAAAEFFARKGLCAEAVTHYLAGEDREAAAVVLEAAAPALYQRGEWALLAEMIAGLQRQAHPIRPHLPLWRARCLVQLGEPDAALALAEEFGKNDALDATAYALREIVRCGALRNKGKIDDALAAARSALVHLEGSPESSQARLLRAEAHHYIGVALQMAGLHREAPAELGMALTLYELLGSAYHLSRVHNNLGISLYRLGRYPEAVAHYEQAIEGSRRLGNTPNLASALNNLGNLYTLIGSFSLAEDVLKSALEAARLCGNTRVEAYASCSLGRALTGAGHLHEARGMLQDAVRLAQLSGERVLETQALLHEVIACAYAGDLDEAGALNREAEELLGSDPAPYTAGLVGFSQGLCSLLAGDASKALRRLAGAAAQFDQSGDIRWRERSTLLLAQAAYQQRDLAAVAEYLDSIRETAQSEAGPASLRQDAPVAQEVLRHAVRALPAGAAFGRLCAVADAAASPAEPANAARLISLERPIVKAYGLGDFSVELNGVTLDESKGLTAKAKELLFFLLSTGRRTRREELMEALWPENDMLKDTSVLRTNVYRLRRVLYDHCIAVQGDSYRIDPAGHFWFDLHYFNELVQRSRQSQCSPVERVMLLETAVQLYRGPYLDEISSDWCVAKRYDVEIRFASAALSLATSYLQDGSAASALQLCERVLASDPFNEEAVLLLIRAHLALGDRNAALLHWRSFERRLQSETGSRPSRDIASRSELLLRAS